MTGVTIIYTLMAMLIGNGLTANLTILDPADQIQLDSSIHNKTDFCNSLKLKDLPDYELIYIVENTSDENVIYFQNKVKAMEAKGIDMHAKQFITKGCKLDNESFLLCLKTLKSPKVSIENSDKSEIDGLFAKGEKNVIVLFEDATEGIFEYQARIMTVKEDVVANKQVKDASDASNTEIIGDKVGKLGEGDVKINISPEGVMGVGLGLAFVLILIAYFGLMIQSADFNPKFVKEKLPQGKEY